MVDLNATNVMVSGQSNKRAGYWKQLIEATLNSHPKAMEGKGSQYVNVSPETRGFPGHTDEWLLLWSGCMQKSGWLAAVCICEA